MSEKYKEIPRVTRNGSVTHRSIAALSIRIRFDESKRKKCKLNA